MKDETVLNVEEIVLNVGSTPEVPVGAHPQPNPH